MILATLGTSPFRSRGAVAAEDSFVSLGALQSWPGQSRELYDKLAAGETLIRFTEEEGADSRCEPAANGIRGERIFDWLDQHILA